VELERSLDSLEQQGLGVAAISYDSQELLRHFAERMGGFSYPLLADPNSAVIRAFGIFNHNIPKGHQWYGICFPGTFIVNSDGTVRHKYFEQMHRQRITTDTILTKEYGVGGGEHTEIATEHLTLTAFPSQEPVRRGNRFTLVFDVETDPAMHVYAPGVEGYRPVSIEVEEHPYLMIHPTEFPEPKWLQLEAIQETVPVFEGKTRIFQDLTLSPRLKEANIDIRATFSYQACDDKICYPPAKVPFRFVLDLEEHDSERSPEPLQRKKTGS
jgi:hypothetical protein